MKLFTTTHLNFYSKISNKLIFKLHYIFVISFSIVFINSCSPALKNSGFSKGFTMGTTYHIKWHNFNSPENKKILNSNIEIKKRIKAKLKQLNNIYSTFIKTSEISLFNKSKNIKFHRISKILFDVVKQALYISKLSGGAYDPTLSPLVDLWGFGKQKHHVIPGKLEIQNKMKNIGYRYLELKQDNLHYYIRKKIPNLQINLSSLAKGHGVAEVARLLKKLGWENYLVEIGGEIQTRGKAEKNRRWKVGINKPLASASINEIYKVLSVSNAALATSGTYRIFFKAKYSKKDNNSKNDISTNSDKKDKNRKTYSHIIDGRNGYPIKHSIVSVSILAEDCMLADGLATMALVLGKKSIAILNKIPNIKYLLIEESQNKLVEIKSANWPD